MSMDCVIFPPSIIAEFMLRQTTHGRMVEEESQKDRRSFVIQSERTTDASIMSDKSEKLEKCTFRRQNMIITWFDRNNYMSRGHPTITGKIFAKNSRQGIIPVLGPVLRTRIKDAYYDSTVFHNTGP